MARRRKGGGRRKPAASRPRKGSSGAEQEQPPPPPTSTATPTPVESEESCPSPGKQQDTSSSNASLPAEPAEREPTQQQAQQMPHKKFGKFRYLIDKDFHPDSVADTSSAASTGEERSAQPTPTPMEDSPIPGPGPLDTPEPEDAQPQVAAAIVTQTEQVRRERDLILSLDIHQSPCIYIILLHVLVGCSPLPCCQTKTPNKPFKFPGLKKCSKRQPWFVFCLIQEPST